MRFVQKRLKRHVYRRYFEKNFGNDNKKRFRFHVFSEPFASIIPILRLIFKMQINHIANNSSVRVIFVRCVIVKFYHGVCFFGDFDWLDQALQHSYYVCCVHGKYCRAYYRQEKEFCFGIIIEYSLFSLYYVIFEELEIRSNASKQGLQFTQEHHLYYDNKDR